jgi:hypothetical protein
MNVTKVGIKVSRIPCCSKDCPQRDSAEHEGYAGVLTDKRITENNNTNTDSRGDGLLERILSRGNLNEAYKQVKRNKGSHGVDGMKVEHLLQYLRDNGDELVKLVLDGKYRPNPVRRVFAPVNRQLWCLGPFKVGIIAKGHSVSPCPIGDTAEVERNSATTFNRKLGTIRNFFSYILSRGATDHDLPVTDDQHS